MMRTKYAIALAAVMAVGPLSVKAAVSADDADQSTATWDDVGPLRGGFQIALADGDDRGPQPGPPRDGDDRRVPPGRTFQRTSEIDGRQQPANLPWQAHEHPPGAPGTQVAPGDDLFFQRGHGRPTPAPSLHMRETDPEMFKLLSQNMDLERQSRELAMQYQQAASGEREKIKQQIVELVNKHFDVRQERRALELKRLETQLQRLRETMEKRSKARKELVERRVSELIGREDEVGF